MLREGRTHRRAERAGALPMHDAHARDPGDRGVVEVAVEHGEGLLGARAPQIELQRHAGDAAGDVRPLESQRARRFRRGPELRRRDAQAQHAGRDVGDALVVDREQRAWIAHAVHEHG